VTSERGNSADLRAALERELRSMRWGEGERLPTERKLCEQYGVARNTVRRALKQLEEQSLIKRHIGRGTFKTTTRAVQSSDSFPDLSEMHALSPADVIECRLIFEPELASLVVVRANAADFARMTACLKETENAKSIEEFEKWDGLLHNSIAEASHNNASIFISRFLGRVRRHSEWGELKRRHMTPDRSKALKEQHHTIVSSLRERDQSRARSALREHIIYIRSYMFGE
jgi:DNA-binding FadR family transcriptional regulator